MTAEAMNFRAFQAGDEAAFRLLNEARITALFSMEAKDREVPGDPVGQIIARGGAIFMAVAGGRAVGCCALLKEPEGWFELGKMAVAMGASGLVLETHHGLKNAIHLYEEAGFVQVPMDAAHALPYRRPYSRSDMRMELRF